MATADARPEAAAEATKRYGRGASILAVGIGITGLVTYGFFSLASHNLSAEEYGGITLLWSAVFITVSILYRPVEQLLSRTIAERQAKGQSIGQPMRVAATIQLALGVLFAVAALAARNTITDELFSGSSTLYWVLFFSVLAYAASYFARGFLAGSRRFGLYGLLVFNEATSRIMFAIVVAVGLASSQSVVALGIAAAPAVSLLVVPFAFGRRARAGDPPDAAVGVPPPADGPDETADTAEPGDAGEPEFTLAHGGGFAAAVLLIMVSEQTFLNAGPLLIKAGEGEAGAALAGFIFNILLIARAPLQLFQAISTSLLPHLTNLRSAGDELSGEDAFRHSMRVTLWAVAVFAGAVTLTMLAVGPWAMQLVFGDNFSYERPDLVLVSVGMGLYLASVTLNQAALAQGHVRRASMLWIGCAAGFIVWNLLPVGDAVTRVEVGFTGAAAILASLLYGLYRQTYVRVEDVVEPGSPEEIEARLAAADEAS